MSNHKSLFNGWISLIGLVFSLQCAAWAEGDPYAELVSFDFGMQSTAPSAIEQEFRTGGPAVYKAMEKKLLAVLAKPEATHACKKFICETLRVVGSEACVEPLSKLLGDEKLSDLARYPLQTLPGKSVDSALLAALNSSSGRIQIGLINSVAARHNAGLAKILQEYLASNNAELVRASLQALARVGGANALTVLKSAKLPAEFQPMLERAQIDAAYNLARDGSKRPAIDLFEQQYKNASSMPAVIGAFNGLLDYRGGDTMALLSGALKDSRKPLALAAAKAATRLKGSEVTKTLAEAFPSVPPAVQVAILRTMAERGDAAGLPTVKTGLASPEESVKTESILALQKLGDASVVGDLVALAAAEGNLSAVAQQTLGRVNGTGVGEMIAKLMDDSDPHKVRVAAISLKLRDDRSVLPRLLKMAESDKAESRNAALDALDGFAAAKEIPALIQLLEKTATSSDPDKIASVLWKSTRAIGKEDERFLKLWTDVAKSPELVQGAVLPLASAAGGAGALKVVTDTLASGSDAMKDRAARTLFNWQNDQAVKPLVDLIKTTADAKHKILGMQSVVRILNDHRCTWPVKQKTAALEQILPLMDRPEDKQKVQSAIVKVAEPKK